MAGGGPFPLLMFAPGFQQCSDTYEHLLQSWASAGYVVASVDFPRTDCLVGSAAYEPDLVNQPGDVSYVLSRLLALNAQRHGFLSGRLNPHEVGATGQSDGGDTVAALAGNTCCQDHRLKAVAVLSGAEWPPMPGRYFAGQAPPTLFVQGSADTINLPWTSVQLYRADRASPRYYLDLYGADHMVPVYGRQPGGTARRPRHPGLLRPVHPRPHRCASGDGAGRPAQRHRRPGQRRPAARRGLTPRQAAGKAVSQGQLW